MSAEMCSCGRNRILSGDPFCSECMKDLNKPQDVLMDYDDDNQQE